MEVHQKMLSLAICSTNECTVEKAIIMLTRLFLALLIMYTDVMYMGNANVILNDPPKVGSIGLAGLLPSIDITCR